MMLVWECKVMDPLFNLLSWKCLQPSKVDRFRRQLDMCT